METEPFSETVSFLITIQWTEFRNEVSHVNAGDFVCYKFLSK